MSEQNPSLPSKRSPVPFPDKTLIESYLHLLSTRNLPEISSLELRQALNAKGVSAELDVSLETLTEAALDRARSLWKKAVAFDSSSHSDHFVMYMNLWFGWPNRAGLGNFCPVTKILFATQIKRQSTLRLLRVVRKEWNDRLIQHVARDYSSRLGRSEIANVAREATGIYFARQFAMQADEQEAYRIQPWIEMVEKIISTR